MGVNKQDMQVFGGRFAKGQKNEREMTEALSLGDWEDCDAIK